MVIKKIPNNKENQKTFLDLKNLILSTIKKVKKVITEKYNKRPTQAYGMSKNAVGISKMLNSSEIPLYGSINKAIYFPKMTIIA